jgi:hypothetical protein
VSLARSADWDTVKALDVFRREDLLKFVAETIRAWKSTIRPLKDVEPKLDGSEARKAKMAFIPLGTKQQPTLADHKAETWVAAVIASLANRSVRSIQFACNEAMHRTFAFPSDLEAFLREKADEHLNREVAYIARLRAVMDLVEQRDRPQLQLTQERDAPMTADEIRKLVRNPSGINATLIRMGLSCGSIDATLLAQVRTEEGLPDEVQE